MKLTVIGGGGVRSMFLAKSIAARAGQLGISSLCFMDNDSVKLNIFGKMARKVALMICPSLDFVITDNAVEAVRDADYVITTIRVGGDSMRVKDERIALNLGVIGQETTGAAGFSFAMRSIPALVEYCELIKKYAKSSVKVFNFTNPAGLVSQAPYDMGYDFTFGLCDAPSSMLNSFAELLGVNPDELYGDIYGLNHLSFFSEIYTDSDKFTEKLIHNDDAYIETDMRYFSKDMLINKRFVPNEYLYYYFDRQKALENILSASKTRGEQIEEINAAMISELSLIDVDMEFDKALEIFEKYYGMRENSYMASETGIVREKKWRFDIFSEDDGGYAGVALRYVDIISKKAEGKMILCTPNKGALPFLADDDIVEVTCNVSTEGVYPLKFAEETVDGLAGELIRRVKLYERQAARAIAEKNILKAVDALALHPLVESYTIAEKLVESYIELNSAFSSGWK